MPTCQTLAVVFGDQLDADAALIRSLDPKRDVVLMMEVREESTHVPSHVQRTVLFLSAMRHFAEALKERGVRVRYVALDEPANTGSFAGEIERAVRELRPKTLACTRPGEWRVLRMIEETAQQAGLELEMFEDEHFITTPAEFAAWAKGRASLTMEFFYREQRRKTGYLMVGTGKQAQPEGGQWNFDPENRESFKPHGPKGKLPEPRRWAPDAITRAAMDAVRRVLPDLPGRMETEDAFGWAVTREQALAALDEFVSERLALFGPYEDAMWTTAKTVYHSVLSPMLNLKLISPRECCEKAIAAYQKGRAPIESVEAFVRQLIGWREFIRGVYWLEGPEYAERNGLKSTGKLPEFYWTGDAEMNCLRHCVGQVVERGYAHHIQRLMVMGNFALLAGVHPREVSNWYLGMFVDGVDWVTLPNTLGMVMHADGRPGWKDGARATGTVGTKPYAASGKYIDRMSNYCDGCRFDPEQKKGERACPFNVLYWDFLIRQRERLRGNQRMAMILKNVDRMKEPEKTQITVDARAIRRRIGVEREAPAPGARAGR